MSLHVLSYNIHKGFSFQQKFILDQIKTAIATVKADLVFLQEVLGDHSGHRKRQKNWPVASQLEYLADSIWPHHVYGKNAVYSEGHHGNAIMSAHPFNFFEKRRHLNEPVRTSRFASRDHRNTRPLACPAHHMRPP